MTFFHSHDRPFSEKRLCYLTGPESAPPQPEISQNINEGMDDDRPRDLEDLDDVKKPVVERQETASQEIPEEMEKGGRRMKDVGETLTAKGPVADFLDGSHSDYDVAYELKDPPQDQRKEETVSDKPSNVRRPKSEKELKEEAGREMTQAKMNIITRAQDKYHKDLKEAKRTWGKMSNPDERTKKIEAFNGEWMAKNGTYIDRVQEQTGRKAELVANMAGGRLVFGQLLDPTDTPKQTPPLPPPSPGEQQPDPVYQQVARVGGLDAALGSPEENVAPSEPPEKIAPSIPPEEVKTAELSAAAAEIPSGLPEKTREVWRKLIQDLKIDPVSAVGVQLAEAAQSVGDAQKGNTPDLWKTAEKKVSDAIDALKTGVISGIYIDATKKALVGRPSVPEQSAVATGMRMRGRPEEGTDKNTAKVVAKEGATETVEKMPEGLEEVYRQLTSLDRMGLWPTELSGQLNTFIEGVQEFDPKKYVPKMAELINSYNNAADPSRRIHLSPEALAAFQKYVRDEEQLLTLGAWEERASS